MKTSLFNPIFVNPQAYFVFPQLYDIVPEYKTLVEPCIFTGTLKVQNSDNTMVRLYANTKSIDLSEFNNSIVTISQHTDIGATVLGQWVLYGTNETYYYPVDFNVIWGTKENITPTTITLNSKYLYILKDGPIEEGSTYTIPAYTIEVKGVNFEDEDTLSIGYEDYMGQHILVEIHEDGVYNVPSHTFEYNENMPVYVNSIQWYSTKEEEVTITLMPTIKTKDLILNK